MVHPKPKNSRQKNFAMGKCLTLSDATHRYTTYKLKPGFPSRRKIKLIPNRQ